MGKHLSNEAAREIRECSKALLRLAEFLEENRTDNIYNQYGLATAWRDFGKLIDSWTDGRAIDSELGWLKNLKASELNLAHRCIPVKTESGITSYVSPSRKQLKKKLPKVADDVMWRYNSITFVSATEDYLDRNIRPELAKKRLAINEKLSESAFGSEKGGIYKAYEDEVPDNVEASKTPT